MAIGSEIDSERIEYHNNTVLTVACCTDDHTVLSGKICFLVTILLAICPSTGTLIDRL